MPPKKRRKNLTEGSNVPQAVIDGGNWATVLGMADLSQKKRRAHLGEGVAESKDDPAGDVHVVSVGEATKKTTKDHEAAAYNYGKSTSHVVRNPRAGVLSVSWFR